MLPPNSRFLGPGIFPWIANPWIGNIRSKPWIGRDFFNKIRELEVFQDTFKKPWIGQSGTTNEDGIEELALESLPIHECTPESTNHLIKQFSQMLYEGIGKDPTRPIPQLYEECREKLFDDLTVDQKKLLAADIPNFRSIQSGLYKHRQNFIPRAPTSCADFDINSDWVCQGEMIVQDDYTFPDGGRILVLQMRHSKF